MNCMWAFSNEYLQQDDPKTVNISQKWRLLRDAILCKAIWFAYFNSIAAVTAIMYRYLKYHFNWVIFFFRIDFYLELLMYCESFLVYELLLHFHFTGCIIGIKPLIVHITDRKEFVSTLCALLIGFYFPTRFFEIKQTRCCLSHLQIAISVAPSSWYAEQPLKISLSHVYISGSLYFPHCYNSSVQNVLCNRT